MPRHKTLTEAYDSCLAEGHIRDLAEVNAKRIRAPMDNAQTSIHAANIIEKTISREAQEWMTVYILHYEALRLHAEALLYLLKRSTDNHQCLFAAVCTAFPSLELDQTSRK